MMFQQFIQKVTQELKKNPHDDQCSASLTQIRTQHHQFLNVYYEMHLLKL